MGDQRRTLTTVSSFSSFLRSPASADFRRRFAQNFSPKTRIPKRISEAGGVPPEDSVAPPAYIRRAMLLKTRRPAETGQTSLLQPSRTASVARSPARAATRACSPLGPSPAIPCVDVQTKTWVIAERSAGKPPDLGDADPVAWERSPAGMRIKISPKRTHGCPNTIFSSLKPKPLKPHLFASIAKSRLPL